MKRYGFDRVGSFLVGIVVGATCLLVIKGHDLDLLYLNMGKLREENNQLQEELDTLKKDLLDHQKQSIRKVRKIEIEAKAPDEFSKLAIIRYVKERTRPWLNQEVAYLEKEPKFVSGLIDARTFEFDRQVYTLKVEAVVIGETVRIWVAGTKQPTPSPS